MADPYATSLTTEKKPQIVQSPETKQPPAKLLQAQLDEYWGTLFTPSVMANFNEPEKINTFLKDTHPQIDTDGKTIIITLTSSFAEYEVKKMLTGIMTHLRRMSGIRDLAPKIAVKVEEKAAMPYQSGEKYEAMLQINPALAELRKILPDIDI